MYGPLRRLPNGQPRPGRTFPDEDTGPRGEGGPAPILTYDVTLTDGTIITGAEPTPPQSP